MNVRVTAASVPRWSSIGYGWGHTETEDVVFVGDHRPMRALVEALGEQGPGIEVDLDDWQLLGVTTREELT